MITVGISESDTKIRQLAAQFFPRQGLRCGTSPHTDCDLLFCPPGENVCCDILIENHALAEPARSGGALLVNSDDVAPGPVPPRALLITYGLNSLATATASSIGTEAGCLRFQYCLQRGIVSLNGLPLECQEFPVLLGSPQTDIHSALAFATLALLAGISPACLAEPPSGGARSAEKTVTPRFSS